MVRILFISILVFVATISYGQNVTQRFSYSTTIGTGIAMSTPSKTPFSWQILGYYNLTRRWSIGAGTGISVYEKSLLPIFADVKFRIIKPGKLTPYVEYGAGYSFALAKDAAGGFYMSPTIGIEYALCQQTKLLLGIGYELQKLTRLKIYDDNYLLAEFQEQLNHNSITFKIGVIF